MRNIKAKPLQTLADLALIYCGDLSAILDLARRNGIALTDDLFLEEIVSVAPEDEINKQVVERFAIRHIQPATEISDEDRERLPWGGIGIMGIEIDFIIS